MENPLSPLHSHITDDHQGPSELTRVHVTQNIVATFELTPPHVARIETSMYRQSHHTLVVAKDLPCQVCGVRNSTLADPTQNRYAAKALETHHFPIERSLMDACDPRKVQTQFPCVTDDVTLASFIDSESNLIVLCDVHHRSIEQGIHHLLAQDFAVLPFLYDHYQLVAQSKDAAEVSCKDDDTVEHANNKE